MTQKTRIRIGSAAVLGYIATIFAANWLIQNVGIVNVGFGLMAPAGVYAAGLAFTFRDIVQRTLGREMTVAAILIGAGLSYLVSPASCANCPAWALQWRDRIIDRCGLFAEAA